MAGGSKERGRVLGFVNGSFKEEEGEGEGVVVKGCVKRQKYPSRD